MVFIVPQSGPQNYSSHESQKENGYTKILGQRAQNRPHEPVTYITSSNEFHTSNLSFHLKSFLTSPFLTTNPFSYYSVTLSYSVPKVHHDPPPKFITIRRSIFDPEGPFRPNGPSRFLHLQLYISRPRYYE